MSALPNNPSSSSLTATPSTDHSVTEDERQRILAGILAEDDASDEVSEAVVHTATTTTERQESLPATAGVLARKRIESENAFSSSSEDDDDETEFQLSSIYGAPAPVTTNNAVADTAAETPEVDLTWTHSESMEEFRSNAVRAMSRSIDGMVGRRLVQSSFDRDESQHGQEQLQQHDHEQQEQHQDDYEAPRTAFSFESTAEKVAAAAAKLAASVEDESGQQLGDDVEPDNDYLTNAEHQVLDEILNNGDESATQTATHIKGAIHTESATSETKRSLNPKSALKQPPQNTPPITNNSTNPLLMIDTTSASTALDLYYKNESERESMRRTFQQSISAAVLVSLAHKRYERRRLAAMEIEKVVRGLVLKEDYERVRAILLLLSDDYVRSTNEDARKGGVVALAACAIGLKKATVGKREVMECRDLILASVVHACQDHSQRVRYYATESLFNVTKVIPSLAVQHFFILFEILRSLYADVDLDVRSGAELLDKKLKEVIVGAINSGSFSADACVPVFARFVYMRNKATKQLTLTWLQEFSEKLIGAPILEFLHLFLGGIFAMVSDPNTTIRQLALEFLQVRLFVLTFNDTVFFNTHH